MFGMKKAEMVNQEAALPGRDMHMPVPEKHFVLGTPMVAPWPDTMQTVIVGMGCFWGQSANFGRLRGFIPRKSAMQRVLRPIRVMKKYAAAKPAIMKWCKWCLTRN